MKNYATGMESIWQRKFQPIDQYVGQNGTSAASCNLLEYKARNRNNMMRAVLASARAQPEYSRKSIPYAPPPLREQINPDS